MKLAHYLAKRGRWWIVFIEGLILKLWFGREKKDNLLQVELDEVQRIELIIIIIYALIRALEACGTSIL